MTTLFMSMLLLIAVTLLMLYTAGPSITELRISANDMRAKQAMAAAQGGVGLAIKNLNGGGGFAYQATEADADWTTDNASLRTSFCDASTAVGALPACGDSPAAISCTAPSGSQAWLVSCGWSDDNSARKRIVTFVGKPPAVPGSVTNPLIAGSSVALTGNPTVVNYFNNLTVWTGNSVNNTGNTGKTVIRRPSSAAGALTADQVAAEVGNGNSVCNAAQAPDLICTTSSSVVGPDVIQGDTTLANLSSDQFFANFMGYMPNEYKVGVATDIVTGASAGTISTGGKNYWVEGNASISQNIGSNGNPVVLVVNGNLTLSGSPTIYGIVFVTGALSQSGGGTIRGAMIVHGDVSGNGGLNIIYDPSNLPGTNGPSSYASLPASWRDF